MNAPQPQAAARTKVLCVDDEPNVLEGLSLHLRRRYDVATATSGAQALDLLAQDTAIAVILSDMRMPQMDGAAFLARSRSVVPDAVRILLTGHADLDSAVAAVNDGQVFRFLTKPCPPPTLMAAVAAAAEQNRLVTSERILLEQTLHGSIKTLTDVLALTNPASFGRANRLKQLVGELAACVDLPDRWQVEVAAMLSQLGCITLPPETAERLYFGEPLTENEQRLVARVPAITEQLLSNIPRLEGVRAMLVSQSRPYRKVAGERDPVDRGAQILRVALDFDTLEAQGTSADLAIATLEGRNDRYDPEALGALVDSRHNDASRAEVRELPLSGLRAGMLIADDVKLVSGSLLVVRGYEVTASFLERARNFRPGTVREPIRVIVRRNGLDPVYT